MRVAVVGGGPAGLRAAEMAAENGAEVVLFDGKPSVGRKFLVAGRGGLNLTHAAPRPAFVARYHAPDAPEGIWPSLLNDFGPEALRAWAEGLGIETFAASTGRVYPRELKAAPLLRRWVERLRGMGVTLLMHHRLSGLVSENGGIRLTFVNGERFHANAVILALGGGSWPETGSDGGWQKILSDLGVAVAPLVPANSGWEVDWPASIAALEGTPLKNVSVRAAGAEAAGELMLTRYGLEGGALYQLGARLRELPEPVIEIDFKPSNRPEQLEAKLGPVRKNLLAEARTRLRLSEAATALLETCGPFETPAQIAAAVKACPVRLRAPRPIAEAISSAGGVRWSELNEQLMIRRLPGLFIAGEMIDWEAPTGGYLLQGCFATGTRAGKGAVEFLRGRAQMAQ